MNDGAGGTEATDGSEEGQPDLVITGFTLGGETSELTISQGENAELGFKFKNQGTADISATQIFVIDFTITPPADTATFVCDGNDYSSLNYAGLVTGQEKGISAWGYSGCALKTSSLNPGTYKVRMDIDAENHIYESNEDNNAAGLITLRIE